MNHARVRRQLSAYLEGELGLREESALESHLAECASCAAELRALRRAIELLHDLPAPEPTRDLGAAVIARLRAGEGRPRRIGSSWFPAGGASAGWLGPFALAMGVGAILWLGQPSPQAELIALGEPAADARVASALQTAAQVLPRETPRATPGGVGVGIPVRTESAAPAAPLPSIASCLEGASTSGCAGWDHWWIELALADARRFAYELDGLPAAVRDRQLRRISELAARSGAAVRIGDELRRSRDPAAIRYARRFDHGRILRGGVVQAGWSAR